MYVEGITPVILLNALVKAAGEEYPEISDKWLILYLMKHSSSFNCFTT